MRDPGGKDEDMKELMEAEIFGGGAGFFKGVEDRTYRVEQSANQDWDEYPQAPLFIKLGSIENCDPAKSKIVDDIEPTRCTEPEDEHCHTNERTDPDNA